MILNWRVTCLEVHAKTGQNTFDEFRRNNYGKTQKDKV
jgi:hypothetical protein